ncbi:VOC family protein [Ilumatobacter sp.]|uniref:VOC family protein n=1 Tax=Ilumatobacter sp. TaxID=1967498 RepID=UPI003AF45025
MAIRGFLSHIDLNVSDLSASVPFYAALLERLGFERTAPADPERAAWRLIDDRGAHFEIEVRRPRGTPSARRHTRNDPGIDHLAFHADSRADVDAIFEHLLDHGVAVDEPPRGYDYSPGYYAVGFDDPDGIRLEVVHDPTTNPER